MVSIDARNFKEYREMLGFTNQMEAKKFLAAKDIFPEVDYKYIDLLNNRLIEIITKINNIVADEIKIEPLNSFCDKNIISTFKTLKQNNIIPRLNNQGRRPEKMYFSWMRGFIIASYFKYAISKCFSVDIQNINSIGDDDLANIETFKQSPKADIEVILGNNDKIRIEVQSGFQGINDVKQHKFLEAQRVKREEGLSSMVIHFDLFNGQVAFVKLDEIEGNDKNWISRHQMEGQIVFNIEQNYFVWRLTDSPPKYDKLFNL